jgi:hypothetical protein
MTTNRKALSTILAALLLAAAAQAQSKRGSDDDRDQKELYNYTLTTDKLQKLSSTTKALESLAKQHPEIKDSDDTKSIDETVKKLQKYPDAVAVINKNGLSPREYTVGIMTVIQAATAVGFKKAGTYKDYPPDMLKLVSKANLDFVEQHWDEFQKLTNMNSEDK